MVLSDRWANSKARWPCHDRADEAGTDEGVSKDSSIANLLPQKVIPHRIEFLVQLMVESLYVVYIERENDTIRIISARKATRKEQEHYEH